MENHNGETPYECDTCDYACIHSGDLKKHKLVHSKERHHKCDKCESTFSRADNLKTHQLAVHKELKRFKCSTYDYETFRKSNLQIPLLNNTGENLGECSDFACKQSGNMKQHQLVHSKEMPHKYN